MSGSDSGGPRIELYVRSLSSFRPRGGRADLVERLGALEADGRIERFDVRVWGRRAPATREAARTAPGAAVHERLAAFREWADGNGLSLAPAVGERAVDSPTGDRSRSVELPAVLLAEYDDGDLTCVTPHADGGTVRTVPERLERIGDGRRGSFTAVECPELDALREPVPGGGE
ncbi:HTH domain-containing protein [Halomicrobium salinisoli]|uniref:HTH domain-containing protein n=1 Tax=Halomicrobium salinisoli TaxID=2878391 RepID=UPI001CF0BE0D|nr:HTH domain-containing protein [Halomicrobium salinisoli]